MLRAELSRATTHPGCFPVPDGLAYLPFQQAAIDYALQCFDAGVGCLIGDEMGVGKSIEAIGVINARRDIYRVLVISPFAAKLNWARELRKWLTRPLLVGVADAKQAPDMDITVVNWENLHRHNWGQVDVVIADEAHRAKNAHARRSQALYAIRTRYRLALTGTPIRNRPAEFQPLLAWLDPRSWGDAWRYYRRYCAAYRQQIGWERKPGGTGMRPRFVWDISGASNLDELQHRLRSSILIRRTKEQVLPALPPKFRRVLELPVDAQQRRVIVQEWQELAQALDLGQGGVDDGYHAAVEALQQGDSAVFDSLSAVRQAVALAKLPLAVAYIRDVLSADHSVIVFAHHRAVEDALHLAFPDAVLHRGGMTALQQDRAVRAFQDGESDLFIGSIQTSGEAITLTRSAHVIFVEGSWVPGEITQCEDRSHRYGQDRGVLIDHLVLEGSVDAVMLRRVVAKQETLDRALDPGGAA